MLRPPSLARFYWFAARVQEGKVFFLFAAEPTQVFTQQSSQSPATALLAFKCGGRWNVSFYPNPVGLDTL